MGIINNYLFNTYENEESEEIILQIMDIHNNEIQQKLKLLEITENIDKKIQLYKDIVNLDNTKENYILEYIKFIKNISESDKKYEPLFISELEKFHVCLSDENYNKYFCNVMKRKNAAMKIQDYIEMVKNAHDLDNLEDKKAKLKFLDNFNELLEAEKKIDFKINKRLTWENKELYLYSLYIFLINSMGNIIEFFEDDNSEIESISKLPEYKYYENLLQKETDNTKIEKLKQNLKTINFIEGNFFKSYLVNYRFFLENLDNNFKVKFGNFELKDKSDQLLLEDYIQFLSCYLFDGGEDELIIYWNETFVPLTLKEKENLFNNFNQFLNINIKKKISLLNEGKTLKKINSTKNNIEINDLDKYSFYLLTKAFINDIKNNNDKDWYLDKYLKPNNYENNLFVYKNEVWKNLLLNIFKSKTYKDINYSFFQKKITNYFSVNSVIMNILNEIRFFTYKCQFYGSTNNFNCRIYINGIYNNNKNRSASLLIYYAYLIISCLHEIGGHLNMRYQYFFSLDENYDSPRIQNSEKQYYTEYGLSREKESGETLEIRLFGKKINTITINEALYILNLKNYEQDAKNFQINFKNCNDIKRIDLIDESLKKILIGLDIKINDIINEKNISLPIPNSIKENKIFMLDGENVHHPLQFYYQGRADINKLINNIKEL